ncbi:PREDICTED: golgin IMH1-like [Ceratosolen solmsi marchali]|uniref:Golgin IMH1-like n=1 Tax=Ceratosolen solmsi marchali TaxID=326594 RepID=A0AAJ7E0N4_9HYME|nr:PREDICTED: golgin IMH1-like [Ceratosolen solmsi marchali]
MPGCAAIGCNNRSEKGYTMKCFPRDPALRNIWKKRVGRADWEPSNNSFLCHVHFEPNQWVVTPSGRIKLKKGALPSIFTVTSTRKSPKKRQKLGVQLTEEEEDLEEYEVEYLENDCPFIFNMDNQKIVPNIINVQTQNASSVSGQILQNIKLVTGDALKDLQNENIIIVADENNREIGKIINENGFVLLDNERGKENVQIFPKVDKASTLGIKVEIKEEVSENGLSAHDYDEIERKLKEICNSEDETDISNNNKDSPKNVNNRPIETGNTFKSEDLKHVDDLKKTSNDKTETNVTSTRIGTKRKRKIKAKSPNEENLKTSQHASGIDKTQFTEDVSDIINDLETESSIECISKQSKYISSIMTLNTDKTNNTCKPIIKNDIQLKFKNDIVINKPVSNKNINCENSNSFKHSNELTAKLNIQGEVIEKLTNQLILYKDMDRKIRALTQELQNKNNEIEMLNRKVAIKRSQLERKAPKNESIDLKDVNEIDLINKLDFLEDTNKKLMKTVTLEGQNRRKLECQIKSRDNQIKELNWKLEKASKFLDRAEKNSNNYRKKMLNMQALIRRKKLLNETTSIFDELLICQSNQNFSKNSLKIALEIEKICSTEGYQKLLNYKFPLPTLKELNRNYPDKTNYYKTNEEISLENGKTDTNIEIVSTDQKMENIEYLDPEFLNEPGETVIGTVQDIFNENSDNEDFNLNELKKHIMINFDSTT